MSLQNQYRIQKSRMGKPHPTLVYGDYHPLCFFLYLSIKKKRSFAETYNPWLIFPFCNVTFQALLCVARIYIWTRHLRLPDSYLPSENMFERYRMALVNMYAKSDCIGYEYTVFDGIKYHDLVSWNSIIGGFGIMVSQ